MQGLDLPPDRLIAVGLVQVGPRIVVQLAQIVQADQRRLDVGEVVERPLPPPDPPLIDLPGGQGGIRVRAEPGANRASGSRLGPSTTRVMSMPK